MSRTHLTLACAAVLFIGGISPLFSAAAAPAAAEEKPAVARSVEEDPLYQRLLKLYRGQSPAEEIGKLESEDPGPALYLSGNATAERGILRFFASLPDTAHAALRRDGYLKWKLDAVPAAPRRLLQEKLRQLELRRPKNVAPPQGPAYLGFLRVEVKGVEGFQYAWWYQDDPERLPAWLTVVRVRRTGTQDYDDAYQERFAELETAAESKPIPSGEWVKLKELPRPVAPPEEVTPALIDEAYYWKVVKAYRDDLNREQLRALETEDPLVRKRLETKDPADRGLNQFFARLSNEEHRTLITEGRLLIRAEELSKGQRKLLEPLVADLNRRQGDNGALGQSYDLVPYAGAVVGLSIVLVPDVPRPVVSWWIRSPRTPTPAWVSLMNEAAVKAPYYYRAHLEQLRFAR